MKVSLNWLRELVDITMTPSELAKMLTIAGFEVEDIKDLRTQAEGVVVGKVVECKPHPNADKLRVCQVDIGKSLLNIVCGAANVKEGIDVAVATVGTYLSAIDLKLKATKLRGVPSEGMICSLAELGLEKESEGIYIFSDGKRELGSDVRPLLGLDDVILDLSATANRADALSMVGVAREVAALTQTAIRLPEAEIESIDTSLDRLSLDIVDSYACPLYVGTVIEGVKIAPSPDWLKWRLQAAGVRPINNVVDATNYILLEWGQPLHAFDREKLFELVGEECLNVGVRFAKNGETLKTLDGQNRELQSSNLLITASDRPVALAGIMGGEETEVTLQTKNIFLEAALFDSVAIRRSSRARGLRTEASTRYERGVNQAEFEMALNRAIALIVELSGAKATARVIADGRGERGSNSSRIELRLQRIHQILGSVMVDGQKGEIAAADVEKILTALGCKLEKVIDRPAVWNVTVPSYRYRDLEREIDLIEEVARLYGYDNFCSELPDKTQPGYLPLPERAKRQIREAFRAVGLTEVYHYSLVKPEAGEVVLANPLFSEYSALRTNLLGGLIDAFEYNYFQGNGAFNAFEIGRIFPSNEAGLQEVDSVAGIMGGDRDSTGRWNRGGKELPLTWYEAKGLLESAFGRLSVEVTYQPDKEDPRLHPGRTASLWLNGKRLGVFGQLHPQIGQQRGLPDAIYLFELSFDALLAALSEKETIAARFKPYSTYPAVERDLAFFADIKVPVAEIERAMKKAGGNLLERVEVFDLYQGQNVPQGQKSLAFSLTYRASDRTLTDKEVEPVHQKIREVLIEKFLVTLRS